MYIFYAPIAHLGCPFLLQPLDSQEIVNESLHNFSEGEHNYIIPSGKNKKKYNSITKKVCTIIALGCVGLIFMGTLAIAFALICPRGYYFYRDTAKSILYSDCKQQKIQSSTKNVKKLPTKLRGVLRPPKRSLIRLKK